jgi:xanthine dehydrogenase accessory factor
MKNIYLQFLDHQPGNSPLAIATVTRSVGSTPQKPGSSALYGLKGRLSGTVGGGVVEGRVSKIAAEALGTKKSTHSTFNLNNDISDKSEAICGGQISVLIDANPGNYTEVFEQLRNSIINHIPGVLLTMVTKFSEDTVLINRYWMTEKIVPPIPETFIDALIPEVKEMLSDRKSSGYREMELSIPDQEPSSLFFLEAIFPPARLIIAGAGHIGKALAHLADMVDFEVSVIDDRNEYANSENIPEASHIIVDDVGEALSRLEKDLNTYVVIVTRGHKNDADALRPCIGSDLAFTGMIGSAKKISAMRSDFIGKGWATAEEWNKIHTPVGLDIKSKTVEEIAVSIAAQLILIRNSN